MKLRTRSHRAWYGRKRWRWYLYSPGGKTLAYSARSYSDEQLAWEDARYAFSEPVTLFFDHADPDQALELYAGYRDFSD